MMMMMNIPVCCWTTNLLSTWQLAEVLHAEIAALLLSCLQQLPYYIAADLPRFWQRTQGTNTPRAAVHDSAVQQLCHSIAAELLCCW
jgi:hypothetical protein